MPIFFFNPSSAKLRVNFVVAFLIEGKKDHAEEKSEIITEKRIHVMKQVCFSADFEL